MYDELVKRLHRYSENCVAYKLDADFADAVQQAADAIEELQKRVPPVPHGRLIDADVLMREMHNVILEDGEDRRTFYSVIERQPTIIPAEEGE